MFLEIALVMGRNAKKERTASGQWTGRWITGACWLCALAEKPHRIVRIPMFAVIGEIAAGDRDILVQVRDCEWAREFEQEEYRRLVREGVYQ